MPKAIVLFAVGMVGVIALYQLNHALGGYGILGWTICLFVHLGNKMESVAMATATAGGSPQAPTVAKHAQTVPVTIVLNKVALTMTLSVTTEGASSESLIGTFGLPEHWSSIIRSSLREWNDADSHRTEEAIRDAVSRRVDWFNNQCQGKSQQSHLAVTVEIPDGLDDISAGSQKAGMTLPA